MRLAAGLAVAVTAAAVGAWLVLDTDDGATAPPATAQVERGDVTSSVAASGKVTPVATRELGFSVSGTLTSVKVKAGDQVAAGQVLASIDGADAQEAVDDARNALSDAEQALDDAQAAADDDGDTSACGVSATGTTGATIVQVAMTTAATPSPSESASASPSPAGSPQAPQPSTSAGGGCAPGGGSTASGSRGSGGDQIYSAQTQLNKAEQDLARAERELAGTTITAPVAAKVLSVAGRAGDKASTGTFITLGVVEKMMVQAQFAEADAVSLTVGQPAEVTLANRLDEKLPVTISQVAATGTTSGTLVRYDVLLSFDGAPEGLLIGQSATASVILNRADAVLFLPQSAVQSTGDGQGEVKLPDGTLRKVSVGLRGDGSVEITAGLAENDTVRLNVRS